MAAIFPILIFVVFFGVFLVVFGLKGTPTFSEPRCVKCDYDLRTFRFELDDSVRAAVAHVEQKSAGSSGTSPFEGRRCPECGADLALPGAVSFARPVRRPRFIWAGIAVLALPALLILALLTTRAPAIVGIAGGGPAYASTSSLLNDLKSPATASQPWHWQELERRFNAGQLTASEISDVIERLIAHAGNQTAKGGNQPLSWVDTFAEKLDTGGMMTAEQFARLCTAYYGTTPKIHFPDRIRLGQPVSFQIDYGGHWNLPNVKVVKALRDVRLDGSPANNSGIKLIAHAEEADEEDFDPDWLSRDGIWAINGTLALPKDLSPGKHELVFTLDAGTVPEAAQFTAVQGRPGQKPRWPSARNTWEVTGKISFVCLGPNDSPVELVTDDTKDPLVTGLLTTPEIQVRRQRSGLQLEMRWKASPPADDVALIARGVMELGSMKQGFSFARHGQQTGEYVSQFYLQSLPANVTSATLVFAPDVKSAEAVGAITKIWGREIRLENIPVARHDLALSTTAPTRSR